MAFPLRPNDISDAVCRRMATATIPGAQNGRRGGAGPVRGLLGGSTSPAAFVSCVGGHGQMGRTFRRVSWRSVFVPVDPEQLLSSWSALDQAADRFPVPLGVQGFCWLMPASQ